MPKRSSPLEVFTDPTGKIEVGWVDNNVLYARFDGNVSTHLGTRYATHFAALVSTASAVRYFADVRRLTHYDLLARSALVRTILANRRRFESLILLTQPDGLEYTLQALVVTLVGTIETMTDAAEFDALLAVAAPLAKGRIDRRTWSPSLAPARSR